MSNDRYTTQTCMFLANEQPGYNEHVLYTSNFAHLHVCMYEYISILSNTIGDRSQNYLQK